MKLYKVTVLDESKKFYFPSWLHSNIGYIWQEDEDHIFFKFIVKSDKGEAFISSPCRYVRSDIYIEELENDSIA